MASSAGFPISVVAPGSQDAAGKSVSAQLEPHLKVIEGVCKQYSIVEDSGLVITAEEDAIADDGQQQQEHDADHPMPLDVSAKAMLAASAPHIMVTKATGSVSPLPRHDSEGRGPLPAPGTGKLRPFLSSLPSFQDDAGVVMMSPGAVDINEEDEAWASVARNVKPVADALRTDRLRSQLGESQLPETTIEILRLSFTQRSSKYLQSLQEAQVELLRTLANLCIDSNENRSKLLALQAAPAILTLIDSLLDDPVPDTRSLSQFDLQTLTLLRAAAGAVLNLQLDHPATKRSLGTNALALRTIYRLASNARIYTPNSWAEGDHGFQRAANGTPKEAENMDRLRIGATISTWAWRVLQDVIGSGGSDSDDASPELAEPSTSAQSKQLLADASSNATAVALRAFLRASAPHPQEDDILPWSAEDVSSLIDSDIEILSASAELIESSSLDLPIFRLQAVEPNNWGDVVRYPQGIAQRNPLELYTNFFEQAQPPASWYGTSKTAAPADPDAIKDASKQYAQCKAAVARSIVAVAGEDRSMDRLFAGQDAAWFIGTLKRWIQMRSDKRDDLVSIALLTLGNLARKDSHCVAMIEQHDLGALLAPVLADSSTDVKIAHGLVGLLKNLSIPLQNKDRIGALGVIEAVGPFLDRSKDMVQPLQFGTVGLLKHLCSGSVANALRFSTGPVLQQLLDINRRTEDMPTKMESTRVLFNVIRTLYSSAAAGQAVAAKQLVASTDTARALSEMVRTGAKYPILVNEGVIALTLLATDPAGAALVAAALVAPASQRADAASSAAAAAAGGSAGGSDSLQPRQPGADGRRPPRRQGTIDSVASNASLPPPPHENALGMVESVLARRDARMPPQYASNACSLLIAIFEASKSGIVAATPTATVAAGAGAGADAVTTVAQRTVAALQTLSEQGPAEALAASASALRLARERAPAAPAAAA